MIALQQPQTTVLYDYPLLAEAISVWDWKRKSGEGFSGVGYPNQSTIARLAVSSRQWDSEGDVMDSAHESSMADIIDDAILELEPVERALVLYGQCHVYSSWVRDMDPLRAQVRYEDALVNLATRARKAGLVV